MNRLARACDRLRHAFSTNTAARISNEEKDMLDVAAKAIVDRGMAAPAVMLLDSMKPLGDLASGFAPFLEPMLAPLMSAEKLQAIQSLLGRRDAIEALVQAIERLSGQATSPSAKTKDRPRDE